MRDGSEPAFEVLFDRYYRGLVGFCVHMLGSVEEAEDAVQHAFLAAYRTIVTNERRIVLRPWLYAVARNRCLAVLHARRERPGIPPKEPATENLYAEVQRREDVRDLLGDLARLPEDQRAALLLAEAGAMPHAEIAAVLGCPRTKVKALVFQARSSLIAGRTARATPCTEIREQIATLHGPALRRRTIRRHLPHCAGCREFRDEVRRQRRALAIALPVTPSLALKESVLAALFGTGAAGAGGAAAGAGSAAALAAKALSVAALLAAGGAGLALRHDDPPATGRAAAPTERAGPSLGDPPPRRVAVTAEPAADERSEQGARRLRTREGHSVQSPERTAALSEQATRRGSDAAPTEEVSKPQRGGRRESPSEDEATDAKSRRPSRQPKPVEPQRAPAPPKAPAPPGGAQSPEPIREAVDLNAEFDTDDEDDDDPVATTADEDDDDSDGNMADEDDDDSDGNTAEEDIE